MGTMRLLIFGATVLGAVAVGILLPPIYQDPAYHHFADDRTLLGIPNCWNVLSNAPFFLIGALGLGATRREAAFAERWERWPFVTMFVGVLLIGLGSGYYHLAPDSARLVWDRLPMTIVFMAVFGVTLIERVDARVGAWLWVPLIALGAASVFAWRFTGDLRCYVIVQFYPMVAVPLLLLLRPPRYTHGHDLMLMIVFYAIAKALEHFDARIFALGHVVSGHSLKHLTSALAAAWLVQMVRQRMVVDAPGGIG